MGKARALPFISHTGMFMFGTPVYRLTGQSPYLPRLEALGEGGVIFLRLANCCSVESWAKPTVLNNNIQINSTRPLINSGIPGFIYFYFSYFRNCILP